MPQDSPQHHIWLGTFEIESPATNSCSPPSKPHLRAGLGCKGEPAALGTVGDDVGDIVVKPIHTLQCRQYRQRMAEWADCKACKCVFIERSGFIQQGRRHQQQCQL